MGRLLLWVKHFLGHHKTYPPIQCIHPVCKINSRNVAIGDLKVSLPTYPAFPMIPVTYLCLASFPGPTSQTIGKAGGGPGTFWHVTDVKLRRHGRGFPLAKRCTNARLRDRAQKSERRRVLARGRYKDQDG